METLLLNQNIYSFTGLFKDFDQRFKALILENNFRWLSPQVFVLTSKNLYYNFKFTTFIRCSNGKCTR